MAVRLIGNIKVKKMFDKKKLFSINSHILLASLILALAFFVLPSKSILAEEIITGNKSLTEDINGPVVIGADNITLDCHNHKIIGSADHRDNIGIYLEDRKNITIKNCAVENFEKGIYLENSDDSTITKNNISKNGTGAFFICSSNNKVSENNIFHNMLGLGISNVCLASNNLVYHNNFKDNQTNAAIDFPHNDLFDNDHLGEGNYWSDYKGKDADGNGLGDTPYLISTLSYMDPSASTELYDKYPFIKENGWVENIPKWRKNILAGDILYDPFASGVGHVGLYVGNGQIIEALGVPPWEKGYPGKVEENPIIDWDYPQRDTAYLLRVKKPAGLSDAEWKKKINNAIDFVNFQYKAEKPYDWSWNKKQYDINSPSWYCSELVWAAYFNQGVDLEANSSNVPVLIPTPGLPIITNFSPVSPAEIFDDKDTKTISSHLEGFDKVPWYKQFAPLFILSPVDVNITDKNGNVLNKSKNEIPGATFIEDQTEISGHKYSLIYLPVEYGPYKIQVVRKSDANDKDTYSLKTQTDNGDVWLAQDHLVPENNNEDEYTFDPVALNKNNKNKDNNNDSSTFGFSDTEKSSGNAYQAGTLGFSLNSDDDFSPKVASSQEATRSISITKDGSEDFKYRISVNNFSGDDDFCDTLEIKDDLDDNYQDLKSYLSSNANNLTKTDWKFTTRIKSDSNILSGKTCTFDLVFQGWQENINDYGDGGFTDEETISGTVKSKSKDVIINEVMWMGSKKDDETNKTADEWIELRNMTDHDINIKNWDIDGAVSGSGGHLEIAGGPDDIIPAHGYFLISNNEKDDSSINVTPNLVSTSIGFNNNYDDNGQLILKDKDGNVVDSTPNPSGHEWPKGTNDTDKKWSMERNDTPGDGIQAGSWHTCDPTSMTPTNLATMKSYWDSDAQNYNCGTPGYENLSENDPSSKDKKDKDIKKDSAVNTPAPVADNNEIVSTETENTSPSQTASETTPTAVSATDESNSSGSSDTGNPSNDTQTQGTKETVTDATTSNNPNSNTNNL